MWNEGLLVGHNKDSNWGIFIVIDDHTACVLIGACVACVSVWVAWKVL